MSRQEQIARFLDEHCTLPRMTFPYSIQGYPRNRGLVYGYPHMQTVHTVESLANEFLVVPEFEALRLGGFLGTVPGEVIAEAVEMVSPPFYRQDIQLLVEALRYAANIQKTRGTETAGRIALGAIGVCTVLAVGYAFAGGKAA